MFEVSYAFFYRPWLLDRFVGYWDGKCVDVDGARRTGLLHQLDADKPGQLGRGPELRLVHGFWTLGRRRVYEAQTLHLWEITQDDRVSRNCLHFAFPFTIDEQLQLNLGSIFPKGAMLWYLFKNNFYLKHCTCYVREYLIMI